MERIQSTEPSAKLSPSGELPCILVYSSITHVMHINNTLDNITDYLGTNGFRTVLLKDEAKDLTTYSEEFLRAAKNCVLGVVILDGFRPNVLFEFGILIGLKKPVVLLKDKKAEINIKTLYGEVNSDNCKALTGLTHSKFEGLKNPLIKIGSCNQFSDLSMKISEYDHYASKSAPEHISNLLKGNISKMREQIEKEGEKLLREKTPASMSGSNQEKYQENVVRLVNLALSPGFKEDDLDDIFNAFKNLEKESNIKMPSQIYSLIASLHESGEEETDKNEN